jgi:hypothetical protein
MTKKRTLEFGLGAAVAVAAFAVGATAASAASVQPDPVDLPQAVDPDDDRSSTAAGKVTFNPFSITRRSASNGAAVSA